MYKWIFVGLMYLLSPVSMATSLQDIFQVTPGTTQSADSFTNVSASCTPGTQLNLAQFNVVSGGGDVTCVS